MRLLCVEDVGEGGESWLGGGGLRLAGETVGASSCLLMDCNGAGSGCFATVSLICDETLIQAKVRSCVTQPWRRSQAKISR